jgi:hypothetical protein
MRAYNPMKKRKCASAMAGEKNRHPRPPAATYAPQVSRAHLRACGDPELRQISQPGSLNYWRIRLCIAFTTSITFVTIRAGLCLVGCASACLTRQALRR